MNARNIFISLVLLIGLVFLSSSVTQAQTTYYVNLSTGLDGYNGLSPTVTGVTGVGPKLTINNAITAASSGDIISVDFANGNLYNEAVVVGNGAATVPGSKNLTFVSTNGTPNVQSFTVNNGLTNGTITFTGPFKLTSGLTLQAGAVIGAGNLTVGGLVTRYALSNTTSSTVDAQLLYTGTVNFGYQTGGFTITTALELPPAANTTTIGAIQTYGAGTVTLNESKTMSGILTIAAALNLGGGTLTINGANTHPLSGIVSNGTLAFAMTTPGASVTGAFAVPNITASGAGFLLTLASTAAGNVTATSGSITLTAASPVGNITNSGAGTILASAATTIGTITNSAAGVVTATLATTVGVVTNSGAGTVNLSAATTIAGITNTGAGTVVSTPVAAVGVTGNILQTGTGSITFASTAGVTIGGTTTNSPVIAFTGGAGALAQSNLGLITFAAGPDVFTGVVTNSPSFTGTTSTGATGQTTGWTSNGQIRFAATASDLTFTGGIVVGATSALVNGGVTGGGAVTITGNGQITFANNSGNILASGGITNSTNWPSLTAISGQTITQTGNGSILATITGQYGTTGTPLGPVVNTSSNTTDGLQNGDLNFGGTSAFFGSTISTSGGAGGLIVIGNMSVTTSGTVSNARTVALATGHIVFGSAATTGVVFSIGGDISNSGASSILINSYRDLGAENFAVAGSLISSGSGVISIPLAPMTGTGTMTLGGINITSGTINLAGAGAATEKITINGTSTFAGGKIDFTGGTRTLQLGALVNNFSTATTRTDFTTGSGVTMLIQATTIFGAQTINGSALQTVWYGPLNVNNTNNNAVVPGVTFQGGDFRALGTVTFAGSKVNLNAMTLFIGSQALGFAGNFINTIGYTATGVSFVSMNGNAAMAISGAGTFGNFEVDAAGQTATVAASTGAFTGTFNLTAGSVAGGANIIFNNATTFPTIVKNAGSFTVVPTFTSMVNVYYIGVDQSSGLELPTAATKLNNLTVATTNGTNAAGKGVVAIPNLTPTVNGIINILPNQTLLLSGTTVLSMNGPSIQLDGDIANDGAAFGLKFVRTTGTTVTGAGILPNIIVDVKSFGNAINGSAGLATALLGTDDIRGGTAGAADLLPGNGGSITFVANTGTDTSSLTVTFAAANATTKMHLSGAATTAKGGRLILGANLVQGGNLVNAAGGTVNVGTFTYTVEGTANTVDQTSATVGTGTLNLQMGAATSLGITTGAATIAANVQVTTASTTAFTLSLTTNNLTVSGNLTIAGAATVDVANGLTLTAAGQNLAFTTTAANAVTAVSGGTTGILKLNAITPPLTFSFSGTPSITNLTISNNVNLVNAGTSAAGLKVTSAFVHTAGILNFGNMDLTFQTAFTRTSASTAAYQAGTGYMILDGGPAGLTVIQGSDGFSVPNLRVIASAAFNVTLSSGTTQGTVTVTTAFDLANGAQTFTTNGKLAIANLATVNYTSGAIDVVPVYAGTITLVGSGFATGATFPALIWPTTPTTFGVTTLIINGAAGGNTIALPDSRSISKALTLTLGTLTIPASKTLTVADSALITVNAGIISAATGSVVYGNGISVQYVPSAAAYSSNGVELPATILNLSFTRLGNSGNFTTTLNTPVTITGTLSIKNNLTTNAAITLNGDLIIATDAFSNASQPVTSFNAALTLAGTANTKIIVPPTPATGIALTALTISKATSQTTVTLTGGNLNMSGAGDVVTFVKGLLLTDSIAYIWINDGGITSSGQGFVRNVAVGQLSHVVGNVRKTIKEGSVQAFGRNEFPVGSLVAYCPVAITALGGDHTLGVNVTINHNSVAPTGIVGLPIKDGVAPGIDISRYAGLSWSIKSDISLGNTIFDLELTNPNFTDYDDIANVRIIRRIGTSIDLANTWLLQGVNYDNFVAAGIPTVVNVGSVGGIRPEGAIFTYGMKTKFVVAPFPDVIISKVGGAYSPNPLKIVLAGKFTNGVGTLTYIASSTNNTVATATVVGDTLKVVPLTDGSTTITVKATDQNNDFATASFSVQMRSTAVPVIELPTVFSLSQNYPNPFNPTTNIKFGIPQNSSVKITIYDMLGREVATLVNTNYTPGYYTVPFNASKLASGMYIYRMTSQSLSGDQQIFTSTKKLMLLK